MQHSSALGRSFPRDKPQARSPIAKAPPQPAESRPKLPSARVGRRSRLVGIVGSFALGVVFMTLAIMGLVHFGSLFWFFSSLTAALALFSLHSGGAALQTCLRDSQEAS
jgi:hypothetical protein